MKVQIEMRYPEAGFVMIHVGTENERRMVFAPYHTVAQTKPAENEPLVLTTGNWGELSKSEKLACRDALKIKFPSRKVIIPE